MEISEQGKKATEQAIKWGTHHISPKDSSTHQKRTQLGAVNRAHMTHIVCAAHGEKEDGEGGVVILLHEKWRHRVSNSVKSQTSRKRPLGYTSP